MAVSIACHIHSDWSYDGSWSLQALAQEFARRGYRAIMVTDHDKGFSETRLRLHREACAQASSERILVVPGIEYSDAENLVHVLVWGPLPFLGEGVPTTTLLKAVQTANGLAVLAHPSRRNAWKSFDSSWGKNLLGIEYWNRKTDGWAPSRTAATLLTRTGCLPFVGLDFHSRRQLFPLAMVLDLPSEVTEQSVLECLRSRRCRACSFGYPVDGRLLSGAGPALGLAEQGRRALARVWKRFTARKPVQRPVPS